MDLSVSAVGPRCLPDLRPAADAAATPRTTAPPRALAQGPVVAPASPSQEALLARSVLGGRAVVPVASTAPAGEVRPEPPMPLALKPWGVPLLPSEERRQSEAVARSAEAEAARLRADARRATEAATGDKTVCATSGDAAPRPGPMGNPTPASAPPAADTSPAMAGMAAQAQRPALLAAAVPTEAKARPPAPAFGARPPSSLMPRVFSSA